MKVGWSVTLVATNNLITNWGRTIALLKIAAAFSSLSLGDWDDHY